MTTPLSARTRRAIILSTQDMLDGGLPPELAAAKARKFLTSIIGDNGPHSPEFQDNFDECLQIIQTVIGCPIPPEPTSVN